MSLMMSVLAFTTSASLLLVIQSAGQKLQSSDDLAILTFITFTGTEPSQGIACKTAIEIAIQEANARENFLPTFRSVIADYRDEARSGILAPRQLIAFYRDFEFVPRPNLRTGTMTYPSPLIIGPYYSLGCTTIGTMVQALDMVIVTPSCPSSQLTANRKLYPNLYRIKVGTNSDATIMPQLLLAKQFLNQTNIKVAILLSQSNSQTFEMSAERSGFEVAYTNQLWENEDTYFRALKESGAGTIFFELTSPAQLVAFLCRAFQNGIRADEFVFIAQMMTVFDVNSRGFGLPSACTREMLQEQMKSVYFVGPPSEPLKEQMPVTTLGYDYAYFQQRFLNITNNIRPFDYDNRLYCHDAALLGLIALNQTEQKLNAMNMSLKNFRARPYIVGRLFNETVAAIEFSGLRYQNFKYSPRLENEADKQVAAKWNWKSPNVGLQFIAEFNPKPGMDDLGGYEMTLLNQPS